MSDELPSEDTTEEEDTIDLSQLAGMAISETLEPNKFTYYGKSSRTIALLGEITDESASAFISQLMELNDESEDPISVHLNTPGGSVTDAFAIYDMIKIIESPVVIWVIGNCMSAGLLILQAADLRVTTPNSLFFYHQAVMSEVNVFSAEHVESLRDYYHKMNKDYDDALRERAGMSKKTWKKEFEARTSKYFTADKAAKLGLVDVVLTYTDKPKLEVEVD